MNKEFVCGLAIGMLTAGAILACTRPGQKAIEQGKRALCSKMKNVKKHSKEIIDDFS